MTDLLFYSSFSLAQQKNGLTRQDYGDNIYLWEHTGAVGISKIAQSLNVPMNYRLFENNNNCNIPEGVLTMLSKRKKVGCKYVNL